MSYDRLCYTTLRTLGAAALRIHRVGTRSDAEPPRRFETDVWDRLEQLALMEQFYWCCINQTKDIQV